MNSSLQPSALPQIQAQPGPGTRLVVSIVTWRAAALTIDCLASIAPELEELPGLQVYVVDNDSGDGSAELIETAIAEHHWQNWATLIRAPGNHGFSAGNNIAIREMLRRHPAADYVLLLNPDTLVRPGAFGILMNFLDQHPDVGIAGGRSEDPDATPQLCCFRFPSMLTEFSLYLGLGLFDRLVARHLTRAEIPKAPKPIDWVSGALMMVRRTLIQQIGLLDEGYFLYFEETDFTLRARRAGWNCWHVPQSRVVHLVGQSTGVTKRDQAPQRLPAYWYESRRRYFLLNHGRLYAAVTDLLVCMAVLLNRCKAWVLRRPEAVKPYFLRDLLRHSALIKGRASLAPRRIDV